jgi:hypothetical protein
MSLSAGEMNLSDGIELTAICEQRFIDSPSVHMLSNSEIVGVIYNTEQMI